MPLDYEKIKDKPSLMSGEFWTIYADLTTSLSILFLIMYAIATLRSTSVSVAERSTLVVANQEIEDLKGQIQAFDVLKDEYLRDGASTAEKKMYEELMDQMKLLEQQAQAEKLQANRQAEESQARMKGLNRYQSMIKNIIAANMIAKSEIRGRDTIIAKKSKDVSELQRNVREQERALAKNNQEIEAQQQQLERSIQEMQLAYRAKAASKKEMEDEVEKLRQESNQRVAALRRQNAEYSEQLNSAKGLINEQTHSIKKTESALSEKEIELELLEAEGQTAREVGAQKEEEYRRALAAAQAEKGKVVDELKAQQRGYRESMGQLKEELERKLAAERARFEEGLAQEKLSAKNRLAKERAYRKIVEREKASYDAQMRDLGNQLEGTKKAIVDRENQFRTEFSKVSDAKAGLERQLASVRAREQQKKRLVQKISDNFRAAGINASVNPNTGEVTLNFGQEYFDTGSAVLTKGMKRVLEQALPVYAVSVLEDPELAKKISSVEIVGFASPTFKGKYINPRELSSEARRAVDYNMDLSYQRAKSIFSFVFDPKRVSYRHQKKLLGISKVSGLGYLRSQSAVDGNAGHSLTHSEYCERYDCTKSQKVIIKFNFAER